jgi:hypothetical protein
MKEPIRTGMMIALTSATLFAAACTKAKDGSPSSDKPEAKEAVKEAAKPAVAAPAPTATTTTPAAQPEKIAKVHCGGINSCKGQSGCKTAKNACAGQNGCKGEGYTELTAEECQAKGGKVLADK